MLTLFLRFPLTPQPHTLMNPAQVRGKLDAVSYWWHSQGHGYRGGSPKASPGTSLCCTQDSCRLSLAPRQLIWALSLERSNYRNISQPCWPRGIGSQQRPTCHGWATGNRDFRSLRTSYYQLTGFPVFMCPSKSHRLWGHE